MSEADPFGTEAVRQRVLAGWRAAAVRFREDANAEEDLALGGYRDRLVVELAQNAADAASRAGVRGRLLLRLTELEGGPVLVAANTGAPLDPAGVEALATLRASAKRGDDSVGRFGVGFAAVLGVCDEPVVLCRPGGVRFSAADTRALVAEAAAAEPALADELARRDGQVPVLRLPFPALGTPPTGYDTAVVLPLRDAVAEDLVLRLLDQVGDPLLLALPGLDEVVVERPDRPPRTVSDVAGRWHVVRRQGRFEARLLADRPTEERARTAWSLTWALPADGIGDVAADVLHAPTPSDEPLPWPALLIATFPLDPGRRHVAPGPATDELVRQAARGYADLLTERAAVGGTPWHLVPAGLAAGVLDGALRRAVRDLLPATAFLSAAEDPALLLRPRDAVALDGPAGADPEAVTALAPSVAGLVHLPRAALAAADLVGLRRIGLAEVVEQLPAAGPAPRWRALYGHLAGLAADPSGREALAALPVPLAGGRFARGARGVVLPGGPSAVAAALAVLGARAVDPEAAHPLLERLGAVPATPRTVLDLPAVREAVATALDDDGPDDGPDVGAGDDPGDQGTERWERVADAVLTVVAAAVADGALAPGDLPFLADLALPDVDGEPSAACELVLPGAPAAGWLDPRAVGVVADPVVAAWGPAVLTAVGVLDRLAVLRGGDVALDPDAEDAVPARLDGWPEWVEACRRAAPALDGPDQVLVAELVAVADLDAVSAARWPDVLAAVATDPALRAAVVEPAVLVAGARSARVPSYTAWWLRRELGGDVPWAAPDAPAEVAALLPAAPGVLAGAPPALRPALGAVTDLEALDVAVLGAVLDRLADVDVALDAAALLRLWPVLARLADRDDLPDLTPPPRLRVLDGAGSRVVPADRAALVGAPYHLQPGLLAAHGADGALVVAAPPGRREAFADLLDVALAEEIVTGALDGTTPGERADVPPAVRSLLPAAPRRWWEHETLVVDGVEVDWWVDGAPGPDAVVHAATLDGLARGLAWSAGAWSRRAAVAALLEDRAALGEVLAEAAFDGGR